MDSSDLFGRLSRLYGDSYNRGGRMFPGEAHSFYGGSTHWTNLSRWEATADGVIAALELQPGARIVEFGCGPGVLVDMLFSRGFDAYGFDIGSDGIKSNRCAVGNIVYPPVTSKFDAILAFDVMEHVPSDLHAEMFSRLMDIMAESGKIVLTVPTVTPFFAFDSSVLKHHYCSMSSEDWNKCFESNGLDVVMSGSELSRFGQPFTHGPMNYPFVLKTGNLAIDRRKFYYPKMSSIAGGGAMVKVLCTHPYKTVSGSLGVEINPGINEFPAEIANSLLLSGIVKPVEEPVEEPLRDEVASDVAAEPEVATEQAESEPQERTTKSKRKRG